MQVSIQLVELQSVGCVRTKCKDDKDDRQMNTRANQDDGANGIIQNLCVCCARIFYLRTQVLQEVAFKGALSGNSSSPTHVMFTDDAQFVVQSLVPVQAA